ncbi:hypothetical protein EMIT0196MI5_90068 [Pseudomonas sp. IT-196MI5]
MCWFTSGEDAFVAMRRSDKPPRHKEPFDSGVTQVGPAFKALRNAINNFRMSCGSSRCGVGSSVMFSSL